jgi:hypothetical protein
MATTPSNYNRLLTSIPTSFGGQGLRAPVPGMLRSIATREPSTRAAHLLAQQKEPEDANLTGGTRTLDRRLLALNLYGSAIKTKGIEITAKAISVRPAQLACSTAA